MPPPALLGSAQPKHPPHYPGIFATQPHPSINFRSIQASLLWCTLFVFALHFVLCTLHFLDVSLIHHQNPTRCGKQPKHPKKFALLALSFLDT
jgi:hypothetical protein